MVTLISHCEQEEDVIDRCVNEIVNLGLIPEKREKAEEKMFKKIGGVIRNFCTCSMDIDGKNVEILKDNICEFRISIPGSNNLLRIIFAREKNQLILLTGYLIKPDGYDDKKTILTTNTAYKKEIQNAEIIYQDFSTQKKYTYITVAL